MKYFTVLSLQDYGLTRGDATRIFQMLCRYIQWNHVQVIRPVILKGKATTTTMTLRALNVDTVWELVQDRLINPRRSLLSNWITIARLIEAIKNKG
jgi:hypothetical protein